MEPAKRQNETAEKPSQDLLGEGPPRHLWRWAAGLLILALAAAGLVAIFANQDQSFRYRTEPAQRGDLTVTVTATGVLQPVNQVEVGTEVSGTVESVAADFNDRVKQGQVLATLDTEQLEARYRQSQAALALAKARVQEARATLTETRSRLRRAQELARKELGSREASEAAEAAYQRAQAALAVAGSQVTQAQAQLDAEQTALEKAKIRSPIDGIVLKRQVEPGQTVAASLQTPVLFVLAENLAQMELHVAVDEADVGRIAEGQAATFTVDAYPDRTFEANITQVRYSPETVEGVVTYETVLQVDNRDLALRPGMTATAEIRVEQLKDVILIPAAALRFTPPARGEDGRRGGGLVGALLPRRPRGPDGRRRESGEAQGRQRVWTLRQGELVPVPIAAGPSEGGMVAVLEGEVTTGMPLVVDVLAAGR